MLRTLIEQAQRLPGEVETLIRQAAETKQRLHDLLQDRAKLEAQVAGEVANETNGDGKKKYPNEEARKAEIARRLQASEIYQVNEEAIRKARESVVDPWRPRWTGPATSTGRQRRSSTSWRRRSKPGGRTWRKR